MMKKLLIVANTPSPNTSLLAESVLKGARHPDIEGIDVVFKEALKASAEDVSSADAIIIGSTENFGYMSGLIKDFFERVYYPCLEEKQGLPYCLYVKAGNDGQGAKNSMEKIITGLRWNQIQEPLILSGKYQDSFATACEELGMTVAAGLEAGIF